jgi:predicted nucleotidyltransferase
MNLKILLEDTLGQDIDLIPIQSMKPEVKATMQRDIYYSNPI